MAGRREPAAHRRRRVPGRRRLVAAMAADAMGSHAQARSAARRDPRSSRQAGRRAVLFVAASISHELARARTVMSRPGGRVALPGELTGTLLGLSSSHARVRLGEEELRELPRADLRPVIPDAEGMVADAIGRLVPLIASPHRRALLSRAAAPACAARAADGAPGCGSAHRQSRSGGRGGGRVRRRLRQIGGLGGGRARRGVRTTAAVG